MKRRFKLNMLEPGIRICKICGVLLLLAGMLYLFHCRTASILLAAVAALLFVILMILVKIELYQDEKDYLKWKDKD